VSTAAPLARRAPGAVREVLSDVVGACRGHDLLLCAAGVTFYAVVALLPVLLLSVRLTGLLVGDGTAEAVARSLASLLPGAVGADDAATWVAERGAALPLAAAAAALLPASLYGEGLVRALDRFSPGEGRCRTLTGRAGAVVVVLATPALLLAGVGAQNAARDVGGDGLPGQLLGTYLAFLVAWVAVSLVLCFAYRALALDRPGRRALLWGAFGTGSFVAGTSLGWVLFVSLEVPLGGVYGGSEELAAVVVSAFFLLALHLMVLLGHVLTGRLAERWG
jgi:membrane protein